MFSDWIAVTMGRADFTNGEIIVGDKDDLTLHYRSGCHLPESKRLLRDRLKDLAQKRYCSGRTLLLEGIGDIGKE